MMLFYLAEIKHLMHVTAIHYRCSLFAKLNAPCLFALKWEYATMNFYKRQLKAQPLPSSMSHVPGIPTYILSIVANYYYAATPLHDPHRKPG